MCVMSCVRTFFPLLSLTLFLTSKCGFCPAALTSSHWTRNCCLLATRSSCWGNGDDFWHQACIHYLLHLPLLKPLLQSMAAKRTTRRDPEVLSFCRRLSSMGEKLHSSRRCSSSLWRAHACRQRGQAHDSEDEFLHVNHPHDL